jgi:hypothetical protein
VLTEISDYDDLEQRSQDDISLSPSSRDFAAFEKYLQENLPGRVRETFEAMLNEKLLPLEESLRTALPEVIRKCQAQMFRDWERQSLGGVQDVNGSYSKQNPETDDAICQEDRGQPSLPESTFQAESLSTFYIEPELALPENASEHLVRFKENEAGPSRIDTDSGYNSLRSNLDMIRPPQGVTGAPNACTHPGDFEDPGMVDLDFPDFDFNWGDFLLEHGTSPTERPETG